MHVFEGCKVLYHLVMRCSGFPINLAFILSLVVLQSDSFLSSRAYELEGQTRCS